MTHYCAVCPHVYIQPYADDSDQDAWKQNMAANSKVLFSVPIKMNNNTM